MIEFLILLSVIGIWEEQRKAHEPKKPEKKQVSKVKVYKTDRRR